MGPHNPAALAEAQSASEVFDVMVPPPPDGSFDIYTMKPTPSGERKARGLVHRDQVRRVIEHRNPQCSTTYLEGGCSYRRTRLGSWWSTPDRRMSVYPRPNVVFRPFNVGRVPSLSDPPARTGTAPCTSGSWTATASSWLFRNAPRTRCVCTATNTQRKGQQMSGVVC